MSGLPSSRKLLISKILFIYTTYLRINVVVTSVLSEQSNQSGGIHLHLLLKLAMHNKSTYHLVQEANQCIWKLERNEAAQAYLNSIDILIIEELELINSELYSTVELVLQHTMNNDLKAGNKLIISNGDPHQLLNINGSSFWLSNHFIF